MRLSSSNHLAAPTTKRAWHTTKCALHGQGWLGKAGQAWTGQANAAQICYELAHSHVQRQKVNIADITMTMIGKTRYKLGLLIQVIEN